MIVKVLKMQEKKPSQGDWFSTVLSDLEEFDIKLSIDEIKTIKKRKMKMKVKESMKKLAFKHLSEEKNTKSKSKLENLKYNDLNIQHYFKTDKITSKKKIILFKARTRMINVPHNFGQKIKCRLCHSGDDDQKHLLECLMIKLASPEILSNTDAKYMDIYSNDIEKQIEISNLLEKARSYPK